MRGAYKGSMSELLGVGSILFFFFEFALQVILLPHWPTVPLHLQTRIQGRPTAVEKQQMLWSRLEKKENRI